MVIRVSVLSALPLVLVLAAALSVFSGCSEKPVTVALGSVSEVVVVSEPELAETRARARALLEREVYMAFRTESLFQCEEANLGGRGSGDWRTRKSVLLLGAGPPSSRIERLLRSHLSPQERERLGKEEALFLRLTDAWGRFQHVTLVWTSSKETLERTLRTRGDTLLEFVEEGAREVLARVLVSAGEQEELSRETLTRWGWGLRLPLSYRADLDGGEEGFVSFRCDDPPRLMFVYWEDDRSSLLSGEDCLALRDRLGDRYYQGDRIVTDRIEASPTTFLGREAVRLEGLWRNEALVIGGPLTGYCFLVPEQGRLYYLDLAVYAPGIDKLNLMRQLEALARTFSWAEASTPAPAVP